MNAISYIAPIMVRRQIKWEHQCEATVLTPEVRQWRTCHEKGLQCVMRAKVNFRGQKLCLMHAQMKALVELAGPEPVFEMNLAS